MVIAGRRPEDLLETLGALLAQRGLGYHLFAIGAGALSLLGLLDRPTKDIDIVGLVVGEEIIGVDRLPAPLQRAIEDVALVHGLPADWLNVGPRSLLDFGLPAGALARAVPRTWGGLVLHLAHRSDQIAFKLYAAVDQGPRSRHFEDLVRLRPTPDELLTGARWARTQDTSDAFERELLGALRDLGVVDADV